MHPPPSHPPVFLRKVTRIFGPLLLAEPSKNRQPTSIGRHAEKTSNPFLFVDRQIIWGVSGDLIPSDQGLYYAKFWSLVSLTGWWAHQRISLFQFPTHFASKTVQRHWFFSNPPFFERDPHMDSPETIRVHWLRWQRLTYLFIVMQIYNTVCPFLGNFWRPKQDWLWRWERLRWLL